jgi:hypothetical protein
VNATIAMHGGGLVRSHVAAAFVVLIGLASEITRQTFPASTFEVPAGFQYEAFGGR